MKQIEKLKSSKVGRGLFAARSAARLLPSLLTGEKDPRKIFADLLGGSAESFVNQVGELKGSLLKAAQILSLYGEYYLPEEVNQVLKKVQSQSHFLAWERVRAQIPQAFFEELAIEERPLAAASIGQVHRARIRATGEEIVLKVQYPGIRQAIDLDMKMISTLISLGQFLPKRLKLDGIYGEIRRVLEEEMDYEAELRKQQAYGRLMGQASGVLVPKAHPRFCAKNVLASDYVSGRSFNDLGARGLSQSERDGPGRSFFSLFFRELFCGNLVQTDCHPGNYLLHEGTIVVLDFGAVLEYPEATLETYRSLIRTVFVEDRAGFFSALEAVAGENTFDHDLLWRYCLLASSPLRSRDFDWGSTTLPDDLAPLGFELVRSSSIERPPHEFIFLDRKLLGVFSILRMLGARFDVEGVVREFLP